MVEFEDDDGTFIEGNERSDPEEDRARQDFLKQMARKSGGDAKAMANTDEDAGIPSGDLGTDDDDIELSSAGMFDDAADFSDEYEDVDFASVDINPLGPTKAKPGSEEKVLMLAARYAAGMPLWHHDDCTDHGPARDRRIDA